MGRMKDLGQQLTEKLEAYANAAQGSRNAGAQNMGMMQGLMNNAHQSNALKNIYSQMQSQAGTSKIKNKWSTVDNPNTREAYVVPLSTLANMWRAKYGDLWIDVSELEEEFWMDASSRLHRNNLMEEIEFRESNTPWARLKEDA